MRAFLVAIAWSFCSAAFAAEDVVGYYWAGSGENAATAGGGSWDRDDSAVWSDSSPAGPLVKWTDHRAAVFIGTIGGTVKVVSSVVASALKFTFAAGPFVFFCSGNIEFAGEGIVNESPREQALNFELTTLTFSNAASAGTGAYGGRIHIRTDGLVNFTGTSNAGSATLVNRGEMHFTNQSSAGNAAIMNPGMLLFQDDATGAAAAVTNHGLLSLENQARDFGATAFSNAAGGTIDLSSVAAEAVTFGSLTNAGGGALICGERRLTVAHLNLADGNDLNFDCGPDACGAIQITMSMLGNAKSGGTRIAVNDTGGLAAGRSFTLLDWSGAGTVLSVQLTDFKLQPLPPGLAGKLSIRESRLILSVRADG